jgi:hypothetical protein
MFNYCFETGKKKTVFKTGGVFEIALWSAGLIMFLFSNY